MSNEIATIDANTTDNNTISVNPWLLAGVGAAAVVTTYLVTKASTAAAVEKDLKKKWLEEAAKIDAADGAKRAEIADRLQAAADAIRGMSPDQAAKTADVTMKALDEISAIINPPKQPNNANT